MNRFKNPIVLNKRIESTNKNAETLTFDWRVTHGTNRLYPTNMGTQVWMKLLGNHNKTLSPAQLMHVVNSDKFNVEINASLD
mgnify:CR=1 FL=1